MFSAPNFMTLFLVNDVENIKTVNKHTCEYKN